MLNYISVLILLGTWPAPSITEFKHPLFPPPLASVQSGADSSFMSVTKNLLDIKEIYRRYFGWLFHLSCPKKLIDFIDGSLKFSITFFRILIALAWPSFHHNPFNNNWNECYFQINFLLSNSFLSGYKEKFYLDNKPFVASQTFTTIYRTFVAIWIRGYG